ncbi:MAG: serine acetyltransferase [Chitinophagaceae bacterium]|nr:serine acetyltransferase [Chitinophagaceae bacterium]
MITSLSIDEISTYTSRQLNHFFPDKDAIELKEYKSCIQIALDRLDFCFKYVTLKHYCNGAEAIFNHLHSDQYIMYLWFLANTIWREKQEKKICSKLYYLNKSMHAVDCAYDTNLPDIFLIFHGAGTVLGKAQYSNYFVVLHGCTVGANKGIYPVIGQGVSLAANSSVIGNCKIGNRCTISTRTTIFQKDIADDNTAFLNFETNQIQIKSSKDCFAQQFFNVDLKKI